MEIKSTLTNSYGDVLKVIYREADPLDDLEGKILQGVHAYCFYKDKLIVVYSEAKKYWTPPGGGIEPGETYKEAVIREVREESNMKVLNQKLIGYQDIYEKDGRIVRQTRSVCLVEPHGPFVADPDGDIDEVKLVDSADFKKYFDWGKVGDRIMKKALEIKKDMMIEDESIIDQVKRLGFAIGDYAVIGGGVMSIHGIRKHGDVDLIVSKELFETLKNSGWTSALGKENILRKGLYEVDADFHCKGYSPNHAELIRNAEIIDGIPFISLQELIQFKQALGREKDKADIELINKYLKNR